MRLRCLMVALALLAAFASDSWGQSKQTPPPNQPTQTNQAPKPDQRGTEQSPVIVKIVPTKESEEKAASDARRENEKTENDHRLARFTELLFWATGALSVIALFQLFVFGWQGIQLKRSVSAAKEATELGNKEFISTHRPRMRLKHAWLVDQTAWRLNGPLEVNLDFVNVGNTDACVTWVNYQSILLLKGERLPQRPPYDEIPPSGVRITRFPTGGRVPSGVTLTRTVCDGILNEQEVHDVLWGERVLYLIGTIEYWDVGLKLLRQTAFCRCLTYNNYPPADLGDTGRFVVKRDPDYEYED